MLKTIKKLLPSPRRRTREQLVQEVNAANHEINSLRLQIGDEERLRLERSTKHIADLFALRRDFNRCKNHWSSRRKALLEAIRQLRDALNERNEQLDAIKPKLGNTERAYATLRDGFERQAIAHKTDTDLLRAEIAKLRDDKDELILQRDLAENNVRIVDAEIAAIRAEAAAFAARIARNAE